MPRLIDADALIAEWCDGCKYLINGMCDQDICGGVELIKDAPTIVPEGLRPHGRWEEYESNKDGEVHHRCSNCKKDAPFHYEYKEDYDEGLDGEWEYIGLRVIGIVESLGSFCSECGAKVDEEEK